MIVEWLSSLNVISKNKEIVNPALHEGKEAIGVPWRLQSRDLIGV